MSYVSSIIRSLHEVIFSFTGGSFNFFTRFIIFSILLFTEFSCPIKNICVFRKRIASDSHFASKLYSFYSGAFHSSRTRFIRNSDLIDCRCQLNNLTFINSTKRSNRSYGPRGVHITGISEIRNVTSKRSLSFRVNASLPSKPNALFKTCFLFIVPYSRSSRIFRAL